MMKIQYCFPFLLYLFIYQIQSTVILNEDTWEDAGNLFSKPSTNRYIIPDNDDQYSFDSVDDNLNSEQIITFINKYPSNSYLSELVSADNDLQIDLPVKGMMSALDSQTPQKADHQVRNLENQIFSAKNSYHVAHSDAIDVESSYFANLLNEIASKKIDVRELKNTITLKATLTYSKEPEVSFYYVYQLSTTNAIKLKGIDWEKMIRICLLMTQEYIGSINLLTSLQKATELFMHQCSQKQIDIMPYTVIAKKVKNQYPDMTTIGFQKHVRQYYVDQLFKIMTGNQELFMKQNRKGRLSIQSRYSYAILRELNNFLESGGKNCFVRLPRQLYDLK